MTYPSQQPGGWPDQNWSGGQQPYDPNQPASPAGYGYPVSGYGYGTPAVMVPTQSTNGLAIASLVCSLAGLLTCGITAIIGAIMGHVARRQIRERGEAGDGLALAGIISGWVITGLYLIIVIGYVAIIGYFVNETINNPSYNPTFEPTFAPTPFAS